jgi:hypothetical protein
VKALTDEDLVALGVYPDHPMHRILRYLDLTGQRDGDVVLSPSLFFEFASSLGNMRGSVYPFADGGIRFAGNLGWVIVKLGPA